MLWGGMLALPLTLPPSSRVLVLFCLSPSGFAVWPWPLFWAPCPLGVPGTMRVEQGGSFCLTGCLRLCRPLRGYARASAAGMSAPAPKPSASSGFYAGYPALRLAGWFSIFVNTNRPALLVSFSLPRRGGPLWATSIEGHL